MNKKTTVTKIVIKPKKKWFDINLREIWDYRDLMGLMIRRDFVATYKQTLLGPFWYIITPLFNIFVYSFIFNKIAGISTEGVPPLLFYLTGLTLWTYFSTVLTNTSNTFVANAAIFGKVYFPRLIIPISVSISSMIRFLIQFILLFIFIIVYYFLGYNTHFSIFSLLIPVIFIITAILALGFGIIISSLTTKYRDLQNFLAFGMQLWLFITPIVYPVNAIPEKFKWIVMINPVTPLIDAFKYGIIGVGNVSACGLTYSLCFTLVVFVIGALVFNKVEGNFMDTV